MRAQHNRKASLLFSWRMMGRFGSKNRRQDSSETSFSKYPVLNSLPLSSFLVTTSNRKKKIKGIIKIMKIQTERKNEEKEET
jgi:hypothetical protein